ncbi:MAG: 50S ribosomal protein L11 methyltransferase [Candidatus Peribacteraceae bacterium]|nr:50S ribosomal protein L11 methyltransferase [Candidatus Peribacteraceae bacterium]
MLEFHRKMLGDKVRNDAFYEALKRVIKPGESVVADIGAGTGFLGFLARKLGAKECHLYEMGDVWALGKRIAQHNKIDRCQFVHRHSTQAKRPVQADVVVSETLGNFALEEHILETMNDARMRFLKEGGTLIPARLRQFVAPVIADRFAKEIDTWGAVGFDLDLSPAREMGFNNAYVRTIKPEDLLPGDGAVRAFDEIDFYKENDSRRQASVQWKLKDKTSIHGFALWWEAELVPEVTLSTSPSAPPTHWEQIYLPLPSPLAGEADDALLLSLSSDSRMEAGINLVWEASLFREGKKISASPQLDMWRGHLD